jgi:hypothetical protein
LCLCASSRFLDDEIIPDAHTERQGEGREREGERERERERGRERGREGEGGSQSERTRDKPHPNPKEKNTTPTPTIPQCFQHPMLTAAQAGARSLARTAPRGTPPASPATKQEKFLSNDTRSYEEHALIARHISGLHGGKKFDAVKVNCMSCTQTRETERQRQGGHTQVVASAPHCARQTFLAGVFVCRGECGCAQRTRVFIERIPLRGARYI